MTRKKVRKPRTITAFNQYPVVNIEDGRIWMQLHPHGKWKKIAPGMAQKLSDRFSNAVKYVKKMRVAKNA